MLITINPVVYGIGCQYYPVLEKFLFCHAYRRNVVTQSKSYFIP